MIKEVVLSKLLVNKKKSVPRLHLKIFISAIRPLAFFFAGFATSEINSTFLRWRYVYARRALITSKNPGKHYVTSKCKYNYSHAKCRTTLLYQNPRQNLRRIRTWTTSGVCPRNPGCRSSSRQKKRRPSLIQSNLQLTFLEQTPKSGRKRRNRLRTSRRATS